MACKMEGSSSNGRFQLPNVANCSQNLRFQLPANSLEKWAQPESKKNSSKRINSLNNFLPSNSCRFGSHATPCCCCILLAKPSSAPVSCVQEVPLRRIVLIPLLWSFAMGATISIPKSKRLARLRDFVSLAIHGLFASVAHRIDHLACPCIHHLHPFALHVAS